MFKGSSGDTADEPVIHFELNFPEVYFPEFCLAMGDSVSQVCETLVRLQRLQAAALEASEAPKLYGALGAELMEMGLEWGGAQQLCRCSCSWTFTVSSISDQGNLGNIYAKLPQGI